MEKIFLNLREAHDQFGRISYFLDSIEYENGNKDFTKVKDYPLYPKDTWPFSIDVFDVDVFRQIHAKLNRIVIGSGDFLWRERSFYSAGQNADLSIIKKRLAEKISRVHIGNDSNEYYAKMRSVMVHYSAQSDTGYVRMWANYDKKFGVRDLHFVTQFTTVEILRNEGHFGEVRLTCQVNAEGSIFNFEIMSYTIEALFIANFSHGDSLPPLVIISHFDLDNLKRYVLDSINSIKASSLAELKLKLAVFTDSFNDKNLVGKRMIKDLEYGLEANFLNLPPRVLKE